MSRPKKPENSKTKTPDTTKSASDTENQTTDGVSSAQAIEIGGQKGPEPTRYGDWEKNGRCTDF